jgi:hypothetical protein
MQHAPSNTSPPVCAKSSQFTAQKRTEERIPSRQGHFIELAICFCLLGIAMLKCFSISKYMAATEQETRTLNLVISKENTINLV